MRLSVKTDEWWWGGAVADGQEMPFGRVAHRRNLATSAGFADNDLAGANQSAPLLVSSAGRYIWSDQPFSFAFDGDGGLELDGHDIVLGEEGSTLATAFQAAAAKHFPASNRTPAEQMFMAPQYNTWIEMPYHPTQQLVLDYAQGVLEMSRWQVMGARVLGWRDALGDDVILWAMTRSSCRRRCRW